MKTLYTAEATAIGGRTGHVETADGVLKLDLTVPKSMGGTGDKAGTNPEELFACGYSACFGSALQHLAGRHKIETGEVSVTAKVSIGPNETGGFALAVELDVVVPALAQGAAEELVNAAHQVCPYSNATRGNIEVTLKVTGGVDEPALS